MNDRDIHFQNAAKLLWPEIREKLGNYLDTAYFDAWADVVQPQIETLIAQFLYDFADHVQNAAGQRFIEVMRQRLEATLEGDIYTNLPDLKEWPKPEH